MTDYQKYINALRKCANEHENDRTFTGHIIVADLCRDTANLLEELDQEPTTKNNLSSGLEKNSKKLEKNFGELDCISREQAINAVNIWSNSETILNLQQLPSVTPQEPRKGHWIFGGEESETETRNGNFRYVCSECGYFDVHAKSTEVPYCWHCGAKMESEG